MRSITRTALVLACSAALAGSMAVPASAAPSDTTEATVTISGGDLTMTAPLTAAPSSSVAPGGNAVFALSAINVTDTRAGIVGWDTTASLDDFVGVVDVNHVIPAANATYDPDVTETTGAATFTAAADAVSLSAPISVVTASEVTGNNSATWDAALNVAVPSNALADEYTATLTHSVL